MCIYDKSDVLYFSHETLDHIGVLVPLSISLVRTTKENVNNHNYHFTSIIFSTKRSTSGSLSPPLVRNFMTSQRQSRSDFQNASSLLEKLDKIVNGMYSGVNYTLSRNLIMELRNAYLEANENLERLSEHIKSQRMEDVPIEPNTCIDSTELQSNQRKDLEESRKLYRQSQSNALVMSKIMGSKTK